MRHAEAWATDTSTAHPDLARSEGHPLPFMLGKRLRILAVSIGRPCLSLTTTLVRDTDRVKSHACQ